MSSACPDEVYPVLHESEIISCLDFYNKMLRIVTAVDGARLLRVRSESSPEIPKEIVVDVRKQSHYQCLHIEGSKHYALDALLDAVKAIRENRLQVRY